MPNHEIQLEEDRYSHSTLVRVVFEDGTAITARCWDDVELLDASDPLALQKERLCFLTKGAIEIWEGGDRCGSIGLDGRLLQVGRLSITEGT